MNKSTHFKHFYAFFAILFVGLLSGCQSKADLENINKQAELDMGLAFPVGSLHLTVGDFLGGDDLANIYLDDSAVYHFIDTLNLPRKHYHELKRDSYVMQNEAPLYLLPANDNQLTIKGDGSVTVLTFDMTVDASSFNEDMSYERVDSIQITSATLSSTTRLQDVDLNWSEIKKIEIVLSDKHFFGLPDRIITIEPEGENYGQPYDFELKDFTLSLLKNPDESQDGIVDKVPFRIKYYLCPEYGHTVKLDDDARFRQRLEFVANDYKAAWGFFAASKSMKDEAEVNIDEEWDDWKNIKKLKVRFMEPTIDVFATHKIAAPLRIHIDYISAVDAQGNKAYASWDVSQRMDSLLKNCLSPYSESLDNSVSNKMHFDQDPKRGDIDRLFDVRPDFVRYSFYLKVDETHPDYKWHQHRITHNDTIFGEAQVDIPFKVDKESEAEYVTTLTEVSISRISIDSLVESVEVLDSIKTSELKLIMDIENSIPFDMEGYFTFLDKDSNELKLHLVEDSTTNHMFFPKPKMAVRPGETYGYVTQPSVTRQVINIGHNEFERLAEVKSIRMDIAMTSNPEPCKITKYTDLRVRIGLAAKVDAILDFDKAKDNGNTNNKK